MTTDTLPAPPQGPELTPAAAPRPASRWLKLALALSLAVNLGVAGVVAGAAIKFHRDGGRMEAPGDLAFGPYSEALNREQRRALLRGLSDRGGDLRGIREELRGDLEAVLAAVRAQPFDEAAFRAALDRQNARLSARVEQGRAQLAALVTAMSDEERATFARNLERRLKERRHRD